jgi:hypothetical protein
MLEANSNSFSFIQCCIDRVITRRMARLAARFLLVVVQNVTERRNRKTNALKFRRPESLFTAMFIVYHSQLLSFTISFLLNIVDN